MTVFSLEIGTLAAAFAFVLAAFLTGLYRKWAIRADVMDRPNERSSHLTPTPRGGGAALVVTSAISYFLIYVSGQGADFFTPPFLAVALAFAVALLGFFDDRYNLSVRIRFSLQIIFATLAVAAIFTAHSGQNWLTAVLAVLFLIWMTNLYNFMDGIDGILAGQVATVSFSFLILHLSRDGAIFEIQYLLLMAIAAAFLIWNWHPAKIFMGDVGSCFFGFILAVLAIWSYFSDAVSLPGLLILHTGFLVDTTYTLVVRGLRGQKIYSAHRDHTYQHAVQAGYRHSTVALVYMIMNMAWLLPLGLLALEQPVYDWALLLLATAPYFSAAVYFKAGIKPQ